MLGRLKDPCQLLRLYRESMVLALPAYFDPVPTAALEALSVGTPIITTDSCGVAEFIEDGVHGFIIPTGNVEALTDRLLELMTDPLRAKRMGEEGRRLVDARFRWDLIVDRILWILRKKL